MFSFRKKKDKEKSTVAGTTTTTTLTITSTIQQRTRTFSYTETKTSSQLSLPATIGGSNTSITRGTTRGIPERASFAGISAVLPKTRLQSDAKPFNIPQSSSASQINLNYKSPYNNDRSPVYGSYGKSNNLLTSSTSRQRPSLPLINLTPPKTSSYNFTRPSSPVPAITATSNGNCNNKKKKIVVKKTGVFHDYKDIEGKPKTYWNRTKSHRGRVLIINNIMFQNESHREGAHIDQANAETLFKQMNFKVSVHTNCKKAAMERYIKNFSNQLSKNDDVSIVLVMSHGTNHDKLGGYTEIYGSDDAGLPVDEIITRFNSMNCPQMTGKPKIFILQCCRGNNDNFVQSDAKRIGSNVQTAAYSDMLIAYSTLPGFVSYRHPGEGTFYIQTMCEVFSQHAHQRHVEELLRMVDDKMSELDGRSRQVTNYDNRGFKVCFLHP